MRIQDSAFSSASLQRGERGFSSVIGKRVSEETAKHGAVLQRHPMRQQIILIYREALPISVLSPGRFIAHSTHRRSAPPAADRHRCLLSLSPAAAADPASAPPTAHPVLTGDGEKPRSGDTPVAWGVSPRTMVEKTEQPRSGDTSGLRREPQSSAATGTAISVGKQRQEQRRDQTQRSAAGTVADWNPASGFRFPRCGSPCTLYPGGCAADPQSEIRNPIPPPALLAGEPT